MTFRAMDRHKTYAGIENRNGQQGLAYDPFENLTTGDVFFDDGNDYFRVTDTAVIFSTRQEHEEEPEPKPPEPDTDPDTDPENDIEGARAFLEQAVMLIEQAMKKLGS